MHADETKQRQWRAYAKSINLNAATLAIVEDAILTLVDLPCAHLTLSLIAVRLP